MKTPPENGSHESLSKEDRRPTFDRQQKIMTMFSDNAKTYIQLSGAALGLTLTFADRILHLAPTDNIASGWMIAAWLCFLVAIVAGAFYQFLAVKFLDSLLDWEYDSTWDWLQPGYVYALMLAAFYGGTVIFTIYAMIRLRHLVPG
jgi:hypothetical protein